MNLREYIDHMPKTELHVHLEGSIRPGTLLELADRNGIALPAKDEDGLREFYRFRDFNHFIEIYFMITGCLKTPEDYRLIAYEFGAECARQNIYYAEPTFSIETNIQLTGLPWQEIIEGLNAGREEAYREFGVEMHWIFDIVRNTPETAEVVLQIALATREQGCIALGLGGMEEGYPANLFTDTFEKARAAGLPAVPHAGELSGPESIWMALNDLKAVRLQHGVRCVEDPQLVEILRHRQISLDICPTSNICLNVYPNFSAHPLRRLWDAGLLITIGSDDPPMFNTTLTQEYHLLAEHFDFSAKELEQVSLNGLRAALLPEEDKTRLETKMKAEFVRLWEGIGLSEVSALTFNVQGFSTEDGPGIRTTVFMKGCPMRCAWCHNPEGLRATADLMWHDTRCIAAQDCIGACPEDALELTSQGLHIDRQRCSLCGQCAQACPGAALEMIGTRWTVEAMLEELLKDRAFYETSGGGVTFSGGEPLARIDFLAALLPLCKAAGLHVALDTCGALPWEHYERVLDWVDLVLFDIKIMDPEAHHQATGLSNVRILENAQGIAARRIPMWVRTPVIPGYTQYETNIGAIGAFIHENLPTVERWDLLAYTNLGRPKYHRLDLPYLLEDSPLLTRREMEAAHEAACKQVPRTLVGRSSTKLDAEKEPKWLC